MAYDYDKDIPDFAMKPAKEVEEDGFDPSPYDRLLNLGYSRESETPPFESEFMAAPIFNEAEAETAAEPIFNEVEAETATEPIFNEAGAETAAEPIFNEGEAETATEPIFNEAEAETAAEHIFNEAEAETAAEPIFKEQDLKSKFGEEEYQNNLTGISEEYIAEEIDSMAEQSKTANTPETWGFTETPDQSETWGFTETSNQPEITDASEQPETWEFTEAANRPGTWELAEGHEEETEKTEKRETATLTEKEIAEEAENQMGTDRTIEVDAASDTDTGTGHTTDNKEPAPLTKDDEAPPIIIPMPGALITNELKMTDIREKPEIKVYVEEDILVPDTKEDLASILSMSGKPKLSESEIRINLNSRDSIKINGEIELHTLYIPENYQGEHHIINIQSRLPFKTEWNPDAAFNSRLVIKPSIENIDYTVINERKFRAKLTLKLVAREYANVEMQVFKGIKDEKLQLLKEKIQMTHVSERKTDVMEIKETLQLKDTQPKPERILKYDIDVVENHKQITEDKAVVNAVVYCNILYLGRVQEEDEQLSPQLFQGKSEFTQFIPISNPAEGSKISFNSGGITIHIKEANPEEPMENAFVMEGEVETSIEIYKNLEREIVTDVYHKNKDIICDKVELEAMSLGGSGVTEAAVREIINVPEKYGEVKRVVYIFGNVKNSKSFLEQNKNIVEGTVEITLLCLPEDDKKTAFKLNKELAFRGSMEIPAGKADTKANSEISIKELWFDRINAKQIEVNANLFIASSVYGQEKYQVIQNVCFVESKELPGTKPGMVVYITRTGDTLWNIAKKYRTTTEMITQINELEEGQNLMPGMKLLIVK